MNVFTRRTLLIGICLFLGFLNAYAKKSANHFTDDSLGIVITQNSTYLMPGQELEINVFATCKSTNEISDVIIGGTTVPLGKDGIASFKIIGGSLGLHEIPVKVSFKGVTTNKTYTVKYEVGQANASIVLDKMNVLYIGIDNLVSVAASGGGDDKVTVSISGGGGSISKVAVGKYYVNVTSLSNDCRINVHLDGRIAGASIFRVRNLPVPLGAVGGQASGDSIVAGAFRAQQGVGAYLKDFPFDIYYEVAGYTLNIHTEKGQIKSVNNKGMYFSSEAKQLMNDYLKRGCIATIGNLFAKGPDGKLIKLLPLVYHIK